MPGGTTGGGGGESVRFELDEDDEGGDGPFNDFDDDDAPREGWEDMVEKMRTWRHDAMMQHLYETAAFWGDKVLSWTGQSKRGREGGRVLSSSSLLVPPPLPFAGDRNDAFWLAQIHFLSTQYSRALRILINPLRPPNPPPSSVPSSSSKGKERARPHPYDDDEHDDLEMEEERREREIILGEGGILSEESWEEDGGAGGKAGRRLVDLSLACRYLAAQCQVRQSARCV